MIDREKTKMKRAREAENGDGDGEDVGKTPEKSKGKVSHFLTALTFGAT